MAELKGKQLKFCREYIKDWNATQAAKRAGYSPKTAHSIGAENLEKPVIKKWLADYQKDMSDKLPDEAQKVCNELKKISYSNIQDFIGENFTVNDFLKLPREIAAAIASFETETTEFNGKTVTKVKFKLFDKTKSLELLGRHFGIFEKDNKQAGIVTIDDSTFQIVRRKK